MSDLPTLTRILKDKEIEVNQKPLDLRLLARMFRFAAPHRRQRNKLLAMVLLRSAQLPIQSLIVGMIVSTVIGKGQIHRLPWAVAGFAVWALFTQFTMHFRMRWAMEYGEAVVHDLRNAIFSHLQTLSLGYFQRTRVGRNISRVTSDAESVRAGVQDILFVSLVNLGQILWASVILAWLDIWLFLVILGLAPLLWVFNRYYKKIMSRAQRQVAESFSRVTSSVAESVAGIRVTQGFSRQDLNSRMFHDLVDDHAVYNIKVASVQSIYGPVLDLNNQFFTAVLLLLGAWRVFHGDTDPAVLVTFFFMSSSIFEPLQTLGNQYSNSMGAMAGAERVFQTLDTKPDFSDPPDAVKLDTCRGKVEFRNMGFEYIPGKPVLHNITFTAQPGQTVALVGHTGSGKTSIINLISKFYLPTTGQLLVDDIDIHQVDTPSLVQHLGIVLQNNYLFTGTIMDNIRLGKVGSTDEQVLAAAQQIGCRDLLESLPDGFHTMVGERGARLSLGQRQLVCFSRAMLANPRIFILDEATSSIDTITEHRVQQALQKLLKGRTCFVVAHRLSTIRHADLVLVLDQGHLIERGTHKELLALGGTYAKLYRQFVRRQ